MDKDLFQIVHENCEKKSEFTGKSYYEMIQEDLSIGIDNVFYFVDTFDIHNYVNPHYIMFIEDEKQNDIKYFLMRTIAHEIVFKSIILNKQHNFILADQYSLEFDALKSFRIYEYEKKNKFNQLLNSKIDSHLNAIIENENVSLKNMKLLFQYLQLYNDDIEFSKNLKLDKIKELENYFIKSVRKSEIGNLVLNYTFDSKSNLYFRTFAEDVKYSILTYTKDEKYNYLFSALNDIKVAERVVQYNKLLKGDNLDKFKFRYFSSSPKKTSLVLRSIKNNSNINNADFDFDFDRNIFHIYFVNNILNVINREYPSIGNQQLIEIGKQILTTNQDINGAIGDVDVSKLISMIKNEIETNSTIFYSKASDIIQKIKTFENQETVSKILQKLKLKNESDNIKFDKVILMNVALKNLKFNTNYLQSNIKDFNNTDPITNQFHTFPTLIFFSNKQLRTDLNSLYEIFNKLSNYGSIFDNDIEELQHKLINEISNLNDYVNNNQILFFVLSYFLIIFENRENNLKRKSIESLILKVNEDTIARKYSEIETEIGDKFITTKFGYTDDLRELIYFNLWLERKNKRGDIKRLKQLVLENQEIITKFPDDPRFYHGQALLFVHIFDEYLNILNVTEEINDIGLNENILNEIQNVFSSICKYYNSSLEKYEIFLENNKDVSSDIKLLIYKNMTAIMNSLIYKQLYMIKRDSNYNGLIKLREELKKLKEFCNMFNINYDDNPAFNHTEFHLELLELKYMEINQTISNIPYKLFCCRERFQVFLDKVNKLQQKKYESYTEIFTIKEIEDIIVSLNKLTLPKDRGNILKLQGVILLNLIKKYDQDLF